MAECGYRKRLQDIGNAAEENLDFNMSSISRVQVRPLSSVRSPDAYIICKVESNLDTALELIGVSISMSEVA